MLVNHPADVMHKLWMYRILTAVADTPQLSTVLRFKGGTCAAMRNLIDRFSVDLDFDLVDTEKQAAVRTGLEKIFSSLDLAIKESSKNAPQYFVQYPTKTRGRSIIKIETSFPVPQSNEYEPVRLPEISRIVHCQTIGTLVANKLVALTDRYKKHKSIAGRDVFDIHAFLSQSLPINKKVVEERTGKDFGVYITALKKFIESHISQRVIDEDLNVLLPAEVFQKVRKTLKAETLFLLNSQ